MFTGFQLDPASKRLPLGVRMVVSLTSDGEEPFTLAITPIGVLPDFRHEVNPPNPRFEDEIRIQHTPDTLSQRFIIHLPEDQRILLGDFPARIAFEITVERQTVGTWQPSNKALVVLDGSECQLFQAREFTPGYVPLNFEPIVEPDPIIVPNAESVTNIEAEVVADVEPKSAVEQTVVIEVLAGSARTHADNNIEIIAPEKDAVLVTPQSKRKIEIPKFSIPRLTLSNTAIRLGEIRQSWSKVGVIVRHVAEALLVVIGLFLFTPLSIGHPDQPESATSSLVVTWPTRAPKIGQIVIASQVDSSGKSYIFVGSVETNSGNAYLLRNGESYVQVYAEQIQGGVLMTIPLVGRLF